MNKLPSEIINKIYSTIKDSKNILLHCHPNPDPDSVGSSLAMKFALEKIGKNVTLISGDSEISKSFDFPGINTILKKNYFELNIEDFDLFIILDSGAKQMISAKAEIVFPKTLKTIIIDHHASNTGFADMNLIIPEFSSTAELLFNFFKEINIEIDHDIALNLFMGIYTDTGGFRYGANGPQTLLVVSELAKLAPDYQDKISKMENSNSISSLIFESIALSSTKLYFDGKLAIASVSYDELKRNDIKEEYLFSGYISNKLKSVIGVQVSATLIETEPGLVKTSFRSRDVENFDVSKLALELGGGGHKAASGVKFKMDLEQARQKVVNKFKELYNL